MGLAARAVLALVTSGLLCGCQVALVRESDQHLLCGASVAAPDEFAFRRNAANDPVAGPALGVTAGALALMTFFVDPFNVVMGPAYIGAGIACGAGALSHPTLDDDFRRVFASADIRRLTQSLAADIESNSCHGRDARPTATIVIEKVDVTPGCAIDDWIYVIGISWHASRADGSELVPSRRTQCNVSTDRGVDAWLTEPAESRHEIDDVLDAAGRRIATEMRWSDGPWKPCLLSVVEGKVTAQ